MSSRLDMFSVHFSISMTSLILHLALRLILALILVLSTLLVSDVTLTYCAGDPVNFAIRSRF